MDESENFLRRKNPAFPSEAAQRERAAKRTKGLWAPGVFPEKKGTSELMRSKAGLLRKSMKIRIGS